MQEFPTELPPTPEAPKITPEEVRDLSALWKEAGGGEGVEFSEDPKEIREQMWRSQEKGFREIISEMGFERDARTEENLRDETDPSKRARLEEQLIRNYWEQVQVKAPSDPSRGSGTTPEIIKKVKDADCQARATMAGIALQDGGVEVRRAMVSGHALLLAKDSEGSYWHIDPTSVYEPTKLTTQPNQDGDLLVFHFNDTERGRLQSYYSVLVAGKLEDVAVSGALGNLHVMKNAVEGKSGNGSHVGPYIAFGNQHKDVLLTRDWYELAKKINPNAAKMEDIISPEHDIARKRADLLVIRFRQLPQGMSIPEMTKFNTQVLREGRVNFQEVGKFLESKGELPESMSSEVRRYMERIRTHIDMQDEPTKNLFRQEFMLFIEHAD